MKTHKFKTVDEWVDFHYNTRVCGFRPTGVAKECGIELEFAYQRLLEIAKEGKIELLWEASCPQCYTTLYRGIEIPNNLYCDRCDNYWENDDLTPLPIFKFVK